MVCSTTTSHEAAMITNITLDNFKCFPSVNIDPS